MGHKSADSDANVTLVGASIPGGGGVPVQPAGFDQEELTGALAAATVIPAGTSAFEDYDTRGARWLRVVADLTGTANPSTAGSLTLAAATKVFSVGINGDDQVAYMVASTTGNFYCIDVSDPGTPSVLGSLVPVAAGETHANGAVYYSPAAGTKWALVVADDGVDTHVHRIDVSDPTAPALIDTVVLVPGTISDPAHACNAMEVFPALGDEGELAVAGEAIGVSLVNLSTLPTAPVVDSQVATTVTGLAIDPDAGALYTHNGSGNLQTYAVPGLALVGQRPNQGGTGNHAQHLAIDTARKILYTTNGDQNGGQPTLCAYDCSSPGALSRIGREANCKNGQGIALSPDANTIFYYGPKFDNSGGSLWRLASVAVAGTFSEIGGGAGAGSLNHNYAQGRWYSSATFSGLVTGDTNVGTGQFEVEGANPGSDAAELIPLDAGGAQEPSDTWTKATGIPSDTPTTITVELRGENTVRIQVQALSGVDTTIGYVRTARLA